MNDPRELIRAVKHWHITDVSDGGSVLAFGELESEDSHDIAHAVAFRFGAAEPEFKLRMVLGSMDVRITTHVQYPLTTAELRAALLGAWVSERVREEDLPTRLLAAFIEAARADRPFVSGMVRFTDAHAYEEPRAQWATTLGLDVDQVERAVVRLNDLKFRDHDGWFVVLEEPTR